MKQTDELLSQFPIEDHDRIKETYAYAIAAKNDAVLEFRNVVWLELQGNSVVVRALRLWVWLRRKR